jgi:hypothetical protein
MVRLVHPVTAIARRQNECEIGPYLRRDPPLETVDGHQS